MNKTELLVKVGRLENQVLDGVVMNRYLVKVLDSIGKISSEGMMRSANGERLKSLKMIREKVTYALDQAGASEVFGKTKKVRK